jgi:hypothetical protein
MSHASTGSANHWVLLASLLLFAKTLTSAGTRLSSIARDEVLHHASEPPSSLRNGSP